MTMVLDHRRKSWLLAGVALLAVLGLFFVGRIPQDPAYHRFADVRTIAGIPNFWNVISNLPLVLAGLFGLWRFSQLAVPETKVAYLILCMGTLLIGVGSSYYHYAPSNATLVWDRLPMTVAFMALFSLLLSERVLVSNRNITMWLLVASGVGSVLYWWWTESLGRGDLRPYVLVQFLPMILMPLTLWLFPAKYLSNHRLLWAFALYLLAKGCEQFDQAIYHALYVISGHSLKHVVAALAMGYILSAIPVRIDTDHRERG